MEIIKTNKRHLNSILEIGKQHWIYEDWVDIDFLKNTANKKGFHFTALVNEKVVGSIMVVEEDYPKFWLY